MFILPRSKEGRLPINLPLSHERARQLLDAQTHLDIWEQLWPTEENVGIINRYRGFFHPTRVAHLDRFFINVSNAVSNDQNAPSFHRLLKMLDGDPSLAPSIDTRSPRTRLKSQKTVLGKINRYRNKRAAHWDTEDEQMDPVLVGESRRLLRELQTVFNEIHRGYTGNTVWAFRFQEHTDTSRLLSSLRDSS